MKNRKIKKAIWVGLDYMNTEDNKENALKEAEELTNNFTLEEKRYSAYVFGYVFQYSKDTVYIHYCPKM
jgi:hypothetical protein